MTPEVLIQTLSNGLLLGLTYTGIALGLSLTLGVLVTASSYGPVAPGNFALPVPDRFRPAIVDADGDLDWRRQLDLGFDLIDAQSVGSLAACLVEPILSSGGVVELPVAVNADSLATWFRPVLTAVAGRSGTALRLHVEDQAHSHDLLRRGDVLVSFRRRTNHSRPNSLGVHAMPKIVRMVHAIAR